MRFGCVTTIRSVQEAVRIAGRVERAGAWGLGFVDTAPKLFHDAYVALTASLLSTQSLRVGPLVTNPVSRHWSVHAASARTLEELAPGRFFLGLSTGDGAVHSVGLHPARWADLEASVASI